LRYIGNKRKLLPFIGETIDELGIAGGRVLDAFSGTATVGSALKGAGFAVTACDLLRFSYVFQRAYIVADAYPTFDALADDPTIRRVRRRRDFAAHLAQHLAARPDATTEYPSERRMLDEICVYLDSYLDAESGFITTHYAAPTDRDAASEQRGYFTAENARRIDAIRRQIHEWRTAGAIGDDAHDILLAALLEGTDAVANTAGVYAAWIKAWQGNARHPFRMRPRPLVVGTGLACAAHHGDVSALAPTLGHFDLLYLDPPYNARQYSAYYHIPEILATGWFDKTPEIHGKTGLPADAALKSAWSVPARCVEAFRDLIARVDADHVLLSYNSEGIIPEDAIEDILVAAGRRGSYRRTARPYRRYRSDRTSAKRQYRGDAVEEYLYYVRLRRRTRRAVPASVAA
jgi:adenine-specific DNA-methyltransferase